MIRMLRWLSISVVAFLPSMLVADPLQVSFSTAPAQVERFDYVEIAASVRTPDARNPFTDASLTGTLETINDSSRWSMEGFSDSDDGNVFRIRVMPIGAGDYKYTATYRQGDFQRTARGTFRAVEAHRRGILAADPAYPWHFIWTGTGEHFFFNGTTAYFLMGWKEEHTINFSIERLKKRRNNSNIYGDLSLAAKREAQARLVKFVHRSDGVGRRGGFVAGCRSCLAWWRYTSLPKSRTRYHNVSKQVAFGLLCLYSDSSASLYSGREANELSRRQTNQHTLGSDSDRT